ncbi:MAG: hypothetical protein WAM28_06025 [Chlamydiales bacterium]
MASSGNCNFEFLYHGEVEYPGDWTLRIINMKFQDVDAKIASYINNGSEHFLWMDVGADEPCKRFAKRISLNSEVARTINLSATLLQFYTDSNYMIEDPDGIVRPKLQTREKVLPISVSELPEFEEGKCYRIRVENAGKGLNATFVEIGEAISSAQQKEQDGPVKLLAVHPVMKT